MHLGNLSCYMLKKGGETLSQWRWRRILQHHLFTSNKAASQQAPLFCYRSFQLSSPWGCAMLLFSSLGHYAPDADSSEFPLSAFAALISVTLQTSQYWIPFPLTLFLLVSHSFWHSLLTSYGGPKQNGRRRTTIG